MAVISAEKECTFLKELMDAMDRATAPDHERDLEIHASAGCPDGSFRVDLDMLISQDVLHQWSSSHLAREEFMDSMRECCGHFLMDTFGEIE